MSVIETKNIYHLLIIEDDLQINKLIKRVANKSGFMTESAASIEQTMHIYHQIVPDLIILDLKLLDGDGVEVLEWLSKQNYDGKIILISGFDERILQSTERVASERGLHVMKSLSKPLNIQALHETLQYYAASHSEDEYNFFPTKKIIPPQKGLLEELKESLQQGDIVPYYQPKISLVTGKVMGVEILARWQHPLRGLIFPDTFIPLATQYGLMETLTWHLAEHAFRDNVLWQKMGYTLISALNVPATMMSQKLFPEEMLLALNIAKMPAQRLIIELTENAAMEQPLETLEVMNRLRIKGVGLSIDDFGTGYSSMVQLQRMPLSEIKVDLQFIRDACQHPDSRMISEAIINLGHNLGLKAVVEGIEDAETLALMRTLGADIGQGFYFSRALSGEQFIAWMEQSSK